ncbi:MAG TPA: serine/threonine-protein kinase, partial [Polyangiaceae bacterium]|nr:serine/threonine-protein kinase [Polyangiaceae bacterium]
MALEVGQLVTPSLRIVQRLGAGGMGSVWIADHLTLHTQVVVKIMSAELANNAEAVTRFKAEASAAAKVKSPHVVQMLDHGLAEDGSPYIVMELLEGADLRSFIRARSLNRKQIVSVVLQVAKALGKAHESGVIHRDIKPGNIFLCTGDGDHFVKILDFGIAKSSFPGSDGGHTQTGMMIGSPPFMSPEQLRGDKALDHRADLWSLAVVLFQGLTGKRPFQGDSVAELAVAIHTPPPPRASEHDPSLPAELDAWFAKAFAQNPDDRFQSARELSDALEEAMSGVPTGSAMGPVPSVYGAARSATSAPAADRRWPAVVVGGAVLAALGIGGVMRFGPRSGAASASSATLPATAP